LSDFSVVDDFQLYIKPAVHRELTAFCTKLTGIEQTTVDGADEFSLAIGSYCDWLSGFGNINAWSSWGNYDKNQFLQDYARHDTPDLHEGCLPKPKASAWGWAGPSSAWAPSLKAAPIAAATTRSTWRGF